MASISYSFQESAPSAMLVWPLLAFGSWFHWIFNLPLAATQTCEYRGIFWAELFCSYLDMWGQLLIFCLPDSLGNVQNTLPRLSWLDISCCSSWEPQPASEWLRDTFRRQWKHCPQDWKIPAFISRTIRYCFANPKNHWCGFSETAFVFSQDFFSHPYIRGFDSYTL